MFPDSANLCFVWFCERPGETPIKRACPKGVRVPSWWEGGTVGVCQVVNIVKHGGEPVCLRCDANDIYVDDSEYCTSSVSELCSLEDNTLSCPVKVFLFFVCVKNIRFHIIFHLLSVAYNNFLLLIAYSFFANSLAYKSVEGKIMLWAISINLRLCPYLAAAYALEVTRRIYLH